MSPRVFIPQLPTRRDADTGEVSVTIDLEPARAYGELVEVLSPTANPTANLQVISDEVVERLEELDFGEDDWLLLVGNPTLIGLVSAVAVQRTGSLRALQWNGRSHSYRTMDAQVLEDVED